MASHESATRVGRSFGALLCVWCVLSHIFGGQSYRRDTFGRTKKKGSKSFVGKQCDHDGGDSVVQCGFIFFCEMDVRGGLKEKRSGGRLRGGVLHTYRYTYMQIQVFKSVDQQDQEPGGTQVYFSQTLQYVLALLP